MEEPQNPSVQASKGTSSLRLGWVVGFSATAVIVLELALTRLFSVILFYHYSFLAVALALFGLSAGSLAAARQTGVATVSSVATEARRALNQAAGAMVCLMLLIVVVSLFGNAVVAALVLSVSSAGPFFLLGKALASSLAAGRERLDRLYAIDLGASAMAALLTLPLFKYVQGPMILLVPVALSLLGVLAIEWKAVRPPSVARATSAIVTIVFCALQDSPVLPLMDRWNGSYVLERWNAHSRVRVNQGGDGQRWLTIDKTAASRIPQARSVTSREDHSDPSYVIGRPVRRVAIIGVGGGPDLWPALSAGASAVDGFELNDRIVEMLASGFDHYATTPLPPAVRIIHDEARHALQHDSTRYDVIRANLIDTWAATAAGGFVLAENSIYTVEGWRLFLQRLSPTGVLVTSRWYLGAAPAEAQRLVALAAQSLAEEGLVPEADHLVALALPSPLRDPFAGGPVQTITVLISRSSFSSGEVQSLQDFVRFRNGYLLLAPGAATAPAAHGWEDLLLSSARPGVVAASPWAIEPPTDDRPFFFLQLRPAKIFSSTTDVGPVSAITIGGVRVLLLAVAVSLAAAGLLVHWARRDTMGSDPPLRAGGKLYFALLGVGYMAVQIALLQRMAIVLGHPVTTLALVLASMLLGTGVGSATTGLPILRSRTSALLLLPLLTIGALVVGFQHVASLGAPSRVMSALAVGCVTLGVGVSLGVALPAGMRVFADTPGNVVHAWAINGALSIVGSTLSALGGLLLGSRGLLACALPCYLVALLLLARASSASRPKYGMRQLTIV